MNDVKRSWSKHNPQQCISDPLTNLEILYTNADQLLNKMDDLSTLNAGDEQDLLKHYQNATLILFLQQGTL